jgi:protein-tyrosine phosphatase
VVKKILFVCLGNICRSPLAEGIFAELVKKAGKKDEFIIESAGTGNWHEGHQVDPRSRDVAIKHGISIDAQRARQIQKKDISYFDHVVAMDKVNKKDLEAFGFKNVTLLREYGTEEDDLDVPDPYYGLENGFEEIYQIIERCCTKYLEHLKK